MFFSKIKISLLNLEINTQKEKKIKFKIIFEIFLYNFLKIKVITIDENKISILNKKISYKKILKKLKIKQLLTNEIDNNFELKDLNLKLEKINCNCKIGVENAIITGYIVVIISMILTSLITKTRKKSQFKTYKFKVLPIYINDFILDLKLECIISIKMIHILYVIKKQKLRKENRNERTSDRGSYANSHG